MLDAKKHPDQYRDLVVRVGGLFRVLHRALSRRSGRYHRPY
ncbi:hypothetical protein ACVXHB_12935 [Escherichia coli]